ncbi:hypothetical protein JVT61DRAFT_1680 [Boletus reticuloceps]|uniref:Uncharacterized protein n=1 Tax=Boletus reticuloceps TaxID=495285 RepID=A0A8I2YQM0_9AGAM|nr:hypothetical protein JVT61DRAFT_1680 [Boletus reticuloceps]
MDSEILCGIKSPQGSFDLPHCTSETNNIKMLGFSLFAFNADDCLEDHPAAYFLQQLCKQGQLCMRQRDKERWNTSMSSGCSLSAKLGLKL